MGTDSAKVDCSRGCIYVGVWEEGRAASFVCREWSAWRFREGALAGHSEGRGRPRPARQRQESAPAIRCINNALMYEADEGERQRGNGRGEGRKTRRVLEGATMTFPTDGRRGRE